MFHSCLNIIGDGSFVRKTSIELYKQCDPGKEHNFIATGGICLVFSIRLVCKQVPTLINLLFLNTLVPTLINLLFLNTLVPIIYY